MVKIWLWVAVIGAAMVVYGCAIRDVSGVSFFGGFTALAFANWRARRPVMPNLKELSRMRLTAVEKVLLAVFGVAVLAATVLMVTGYERPSRGILGVAALAGAAQITVQDRRRRAEPAPDVA